MATYEFNSEGLKKEVVGKDCPVYEVGEGEVGVVLLQEWWGINDQIISVAKNAFAAYRVIVPDLYRGKLAKDHEEAGHYMGDLDFKGAVQDIADCVSYLRGSGCSKVVVSGFCMGGALTLAALSANCGADAGVNFYGIPDQSVFPLDNIAVPVMCHYGKEDQLVGFSDPASYEKLKETMAASGKAEFYAYDAGHGFVNPIHKAPQEVIDASLSRTLSFIQKLQ